MPEKTSPKRARIMRAALPLFVHGGYFNTNVPAVAEAAGVSVGTIYHYFKSKEDLAAALFVEHIATFRERMLRILKAESTLEDQVRAGVRSVLTFIEKEPDIARFLFFARHDEFIALDNPQLQRVNRDELNKYMHKVLHEGMRAGLIKKIPMQAAIATLMGPPFRYGQLWLEGAYKAKPTRMAHNLADCVWDALRA